MRGEHHRVDVGHVRLGVRSGRQVEGRRLARLEVVIEHAVDATAHVQQEEPFAFGIPVQGEHVARELREVHIDTVAGHRVP